MTQLSIMARDVHTDETVTGYYNVGDRTKNGGALAPCGVASEDSYYLDPLSFYSRTWSFTCCGTVVSAIIGGTGRRSITGKQ